MRSPALVVAVVSLAAVWNGCGDMRINTEYAPAAGFAAYATYDWAATRQNTRRPEEARARLDLLVRRTVEEQLAAKGYTRSPEHPDFHVSYVLVTQEKTTQTFMDYYHYLQSGGRGSLQEAYVEGYEEGTLVLEMTDGRQHRIWKATAVVALTPQDEQTRLRDAIARMLQGFPPRP